MYLISENTYRNAGVGVAAGSAGRAAKEAELKIGGARLTCLQGSELKLGGARFACLPDNTMSSSGGSSLLGRGSRLQQTCRRQAPFQPVGCRPRRRCAGTPPLRALLSPGEVIELASSTSASLQASVDSLAASVPSFVQPLVSTLGTDAAELVGLQPSPLGLARLGGLYYLLFTRPGPLAGEPLKYFRAAAAHDSKAGFWPGCLHVPY